MWRWYVGTSVGSTSVGISLSMGVGLPRMYVGMAVGRALGILVGRLDGMGVGTVKLAVLDTVDGLLRVISAPLTKMTVVPSVLPLVAVTVSPTPIDDAMSSEAVTVATPASDSTSVTMLRLVM